MHLIGAGVKRIGIAIMKSEKHNVHALHVIDF